MFKWLVALLLLAAPAAAQGVYPGGGGGYNTFCTTQAPGTNNNTCASTAFVQQNAPGGTISANSILGNATSGSAAGTSLAIPSCSTSASALAYTTNTGFSCNSSINAAQLGGATFAAPGAIGGGTPAAGTFTALVSTTFAPSNTVTLAAGTTSIAPLKFTSGTNLTAATAGVFEYDGTIFYATPQASNRGALAPEYFVVLTSSNTLTNSTSAQPVFDGGGGPTNGRITLPTGTYFFDEFWDISGLSASAHTLSTSFGGTATIGTMKFSGTSTDSAATIIAGTVATAVQVGSTGTTNTTVVARWSGIFTVTVTGTVIPQITMGTNAAAANVLIGSHLRIRPVGTSTVTTVGNWD